MTDYLEVIAEATRQGLAVAEYLRAELPYLWLDEYVAMTPRVINVMRFAHRSFEFLYDDLSTLEATGVVAPDACSESRLVAAIGVAQPTARPRDDARLRGWVGSTDTTFGKQWDKGHFIAHSIGGGVDGIEANVYVQLRALNRGWSAEGRAYRRMETYCATHPGALCFSRPLYDDLTARPARIEFGVLREDDTLWVATFANR